MLKFKKSLLIGILLCGPSIAMADKTVTPVVQAERLSYKSELTKRPVLKLTDAQFEELVADDNYEPSHSENAYALYMTDIGYGRSDQYIDGVIRFAMQSDYQRFVDTVQDKYKKGLITKGQSKALLKELNAAKAVNNLNITYKTNFIVELDNRIALNVVTKNHPELSDQTAKPSKHFSKFDVNDYFSQKFSVYLRTVENRFFAQVSPYEQTEWHDRAYITPTTTIYRLVGESHLKPKLRTLVSTEVRYGTLSDHEKTLIMWWMDQLK